MCVCGTARQYFQLKRGGSGTPGGGRRAQGGAGHAAWRGLVPRPLCVLSRLPRAREVGPRTEK